MFEVCWKEFTKGGQLVVRIKSFKTEKAMDKFVEKLFEKDNFFGIVAYR